MNWRKLANPTLTLDVPLMSPVNDFRKILWNKKGWRNLKKLRKTGKRHPLALRFLRSLAGPPTLRDRPLYQSQMSDSIHFALTAYMWLTMTDNLLGFLVRVVVWGTGNRSGTSDDVTLILARVTRAVPPCIFDFICLSLTALESKHQTNND